MIRRTVRSRLASAFAALTLVLAPATALACPYCAAQSGNGSVGVKVALGAFIALPFLVAFTVFRFIRRSERA